MLESLQSILGNITGFVLGLAFCYGLREILRHFMSNESDADEVTVILLLSILSTILIFIFIFAAGGRIWNTMNL